MQSRSLFSSASTNQKAGLQIGSGRKPRSNSRPQTSVGTTNSPNPRQYSAVQNLASQMKQTSLIAQALIGSTSAGQPSTSQFHSTMSVQTTNGQHQESVMGSTYNPNSSQQASVLGGFQGYSSLQNSSTMGPAASVFSSSQKQPSSQALPASQFKLSCKKHEKPIEKICTKIGCEQQAVLCSECYFDSQQHIGMHKEHMFNYDDFISVCRSFSLSHKDDFSSGSGRQVSALLAKLDRSVLKYRTHVKKEEDKIDADFDFMIAEFTKDMEDIKLKLKSSFQVSLDKFIEMSKSLKIKAQDLQQEKESNLDTKNDFDEFLKTIKEITGAKPPNTQNYNFKKLMQNIAPLLARYKEQIQKMVNSKSGLPQNVVINTEQSETLSCFTGITGITSFTLNLASQPHLAPIKDLFNDFKELAANKPLYKNKGEGSKLYQDSLIELKRIYHDLSDNSDLFIQAPKVKLALDFNKENLEALTIPEKPEIDELQFIEKSDYITLKDDQVVSKIDFIKNVNTIHKAGIFALAIVDDDTYVTGSADRTVKVFGLRDHRFIKEIRFNSDITALSTLRRNDGSILVLVGLYGGFAVLNQGFEVMKTMEGQHDASVNCIVGLKDCETVITASSDPKIVVWNIFNPDIQPKKYFDHKDTIYSLELFPCGKILASGGRDRSIKVWRLQYYKDNYRNGVLEKLILDTNISEAHSTDITALKATKLCKSLLFSGSASGDVKIWELHDATCVKTIRNISGWVYKFIIFERPQDPSTEQIVENQENAISHFAYMSPSKSRQLTSKKSISVVPTTSTHNSTFSYSIGSSSKARMISPSSKSNSTTFSHSSLLSPSHMSSSTVTQKKLKAKKYNEQLKKIQFLTASFDGSLKLWNATSDIPIDTQKSKHSFDCFPFGAVSPFQKDNETRIQFLTTGNKNDTGINVWNIN